MSHEDLRTLEEKLAERLYNIEGKGSLDIRPFPTTGHDLQARYLALARECLRQMEWTIRVGIVFGLHGDNDPRDHIFSVDPAVTLAPGDWKP